MDLQHVLSGFGPKAQATSASAQVSGATPSLDQPLADLTPIPDSFEKVTAPTAPATTPVSDPNAPPSDPTNSANPQQVPADQQQNNGPSETSTEAAHHVVKHFTDAAGKDDGYLNDVARLFSDIPKS
jgi:predicted component of type VI protein secretion system